MYDILYTWHVEQSNGCIYGIYFPGPIISYVNLRDDFLHAVSPKSDPSSLTLSTNKSSDADKTSTLLLHVIGKYQKAGSKDWLQLTRKNRKLTLSYVPCRVDATEVYHDQDGTTIAKKQDVEITISRNELGEFY